MNRIGWRVLLLTGAVLSGSAMAGDKPTELEFAKRFGARGSIIDISVAPDGEHVAYVKPSAGTGTVVVVTKADGSEMKVIARADGRPMHLTDCGWTSPVRLSCRQYGLAKLDDVLAPFTRIFAINSDGSNVVPLGRTQNNATRVSQFDGRVVDWLDGTDGAVMMLRDYVPEGANPLSPGEQGQVDGLGVDRVDTTTGRGRTVERPVRDASNYLSDGQGNIRIVEVDGKSGSVLTGATSYRYRRKGERGWNQFSRIGPDAVGLRPIAVDGTTDVAYALQSHDGRDALYRVKLDGSIQSDLVYANPTVDISGVVTLGRRGRVIGASYVTDRRQIEYFDPEYDKLARSLAKALPNLPLIYFQGASADEKRLLVFAGSDVDPGHYYIFDRATRHLDELQPARPALVGMAMSPVKSVTYPAADGTTVPAYLTLPSGTSGKHLPTIVMPHGGPASRDEWGFDWLAQYFAGRGYAVLQPQFRGSAGYGDAWYIENGFKSWKTAVGDINDGARWLAKEEVADPNRTAILGWSYGGYAALQANVADSALFKAVVAIAPVTSLPMLKREAQKYTNSRLVNRFVGDGPHLVEGSPLQYPNKFRAPVLIFHGDQDINVDVSQSEAMDKALRGAGKQSRLVALKGLDHQIDDSAVRADMLAQADQFFRASLDIRDQ